MWSSLLIAVCLITAQARHGRPAKGSRAKVSRHVAPRSAGPVAPQESAPQEQPASLATPQDALARAEEAFTDYRYTETAQILETLLAEPHLSDAAVRQRAQLVLAFSRLYDDKDEVRAAAALAPLFRENVDYPVDRDEFHPRLVAFYTRERNRYVASLNEAPSSLAVVVPAPPPPLQTSGDRHPWVRIFPLGIGHFVNDDHVAGGIFLGLELALGAANAAASIMKYQMRLENGRYPLGQDPLPWHIVQNAAAFSLIAFVVIEVIDAFAWSPARGRAALAKRRALEADLGPLGAYTLVWGGL